MIKYIIIISLTVISTFAQYTDIPYDWSGQYGLMSDNGRIMWNQDWSVGALIIDGTFTNYPTRFGPSYKNKFAILQKGQVVSTDRAYPDSSLLKSRINYSRGDYSYDQFEFNAEFAEKNHVTSFNAFKRSYDGAFGQYSNSTGSSPLQQSYRLDYSSKNESETFDISVGHFKTDSRLNYNDSLDFKHKDNIISAGIGYSKEFAKWQYEIHSAFFQQHYNIDFESPIVYYNDNLNAHLNRIHLNQIFSRKNTDLDKLMVGIEFDDQDLSIVDSTKKDRSWSTIYSGWERPMIGAKVGVTFVSGETIPYFNVWTKSKTDSKLSWNSFIKYEAIPTHFPNWYDSYYSLLEKWFTAHLDVGVAIKNIPIKLNFDRTNFKDTEYIAIGTIDERCCYLSGELVSSTISTQLPFIRGWSIDATYRHIFEHNIYSDGIEDKVNIGLTMTEKLFKSNLLANIKLWGDAYLNHDSTLDYRGFHLGPRFNLNNQPVLADYWVFNMEMSAKVSNMTIIWRVNNILKTAESISNQDFSGVNENYLLVSNSNYFPPMGRLMALNIIWDFDN